MPRKSRSSSVSKDETPIKDGLQEKEVTLRRSARKAQKVETSSTNRSRRSTTAAQTVASQEDAKNRRSSRRRSMSPVSDRRSRSDSLTESPASRVKSARRTSGHVNYEESEGEEETKKNEEDEYKVDDETDSKSSSGDVPTGKGKTKTSTRKTSQTRNRRQTSSRKRNSGGTSTKYEQEQEEDDAGEEANKERNTPEVEKSEDTPSRRSCRSTASKSPSKTPTRQSSRSQRNTSLKEEVKEDSSQRPKRSPRGRKSKGNEETVVPEENIEEDKPESEVSNEPKKRKLEEDEAEENKVKKVKTNEDTANKDQVKVSEGNDTEPDQEQSCQDLQETREMEKIDIHETSDEKDTIVTKQQDTEESVQPMEVDLLQPEPVKPESVDQNPVDVAPPEASAVSELENKIEVVGTSCSEISEELSVTGKLQATILKQFDETSEETEVKESIEPLQDIQKECIKVQDDKEIASDSVSDQLLQRSSEALSFESTVTEDTLETVKKDECSSLPTTSEDVVSNHTDTLKEEPVEVPVNGTEYLPVSSTPDLSEKNILSGHENGAYEKSEDLPSGSQLSLMKRQYILNQLVTEEERVKLSDKTFAIASVMNLTNDTVGDEKVLSEIKVLKSDIVCFQDVKETHYAAFLSSTLELLGYKSVFDIQEGETGGLLTVVKSSSFSISSHHRIRVQHLINKAIETSSLDVSDRNALSNHLHNCGTALVTRIVNVKDPSKAVVVANVNLPITDPGSQALQVSCLTRELLEHHDGASPLLLCGAFNIVEESPAYRLLKEGTLGDELVEDLQGKKDVILPGKENAALINLLRKSFELPHSSLKSCYLIAKGKEAEMTEDEKQQTCPHLAWCSSEKLHTVGVLDLPSPVTGATCIKVDVAFTN